MRRQDQTIAVTGSAVISPIGLNARQSCASIRAGITRFSEHPYYECVGLDPEWDEEEPLIASLIPSLDPYLDGIERLISMVIPPMTDLLSEAKLKRRDIKTGAFLWALPQPDPVIKTLSLEKSFIPALLNRTGLEGFLFCKIDQSGHAGMFSLVQDAISLLISGEVKFCIVGGVDSYLLEERLEFLDKSWRIKSRRNLDGYVPGEAASVILLERGDQAESRNVSAWATILSCGTGTEPQNIASDKNSSGVGLSEAIEKTVQPDPDIDWVLCDLNGESYRAFEWGVVQTRMPQMMSHVKRVTYFADCIGDVGAATGGILVSYATHAFKRGHSLSDRALLWTASDDGLRVALCVGPYISK